MLFARLVGHVAAAVPIPRHPQSPERRSLQAEAATTRKPRERRRLPGVLFSSKTLRGQEKGARPRVWGGNLPQSLDTAAGPVPMIVGVC
jgi:hypothetical protein